MPRGNGVFGALPRPRPRRSVRGSQWSPSTTPPRMIAPKMPPRIEPPPSPAPGLAPPPFRPFAPWPPFGSMAVGEGRGTAGADGSGVFSVVGEGACAITSIVGSAAFASMEASGAAFTVGAFDFTAFGPAPFFTVSDGDG